MSIPLIVLHAALTALAASQPKTYGEAPTLSEPVALADVLAKPATYAEKNILLEGTVGKVCQKKGCWMSLRQDGKDIRITFKDYGFFVPKDCMGKRVRAQGTVAETTQSVAEARHYLKDEGASRAEIKKIKAPVKTIAFVATGVSFLD